MKCKIQIAKDAWFYLRVSTEEQARDAYGLESQDKGCRELCQERGWPVEKVFTDAGVSAWSDVSRSGFLRMMAEVRKNPNVNIVFYDYSRFGRKTLPALKAFDELDRLGVYTIS